VPPSSSRTRTTSLLPPLFSLWRLSTTPGSALPLRRVLHGTLPTRRLLVSRGCTLSPPSSSRAARRQTPSSRSRLCRRSLSPLLCLLPAPQLLCRPRVSIGAPSSGLHGSAVSRCGPPHTESRSHADTVDQVLFSEVSGNSTTVPSALANQGTVYAALVSSDAAAPKEDQLNSGLAVVAFGFSSREHQRS
jgi:hypothetical protein